MALAVPSGTGSVSVPGLPADTVIGLFRPLYHFQRDVLEAELDRATTLDEVKAVVRGLIEEMTDPREDAERAFTPGT